MLEAFCDTSAFVPLCKAQVGNPGHPEAQLPSID